MKKYKRLLSMLLVLLMCLSLFPVSVFAEGETADAAESTEMVESVEPAEEPALPGAPAEPEVPDVPETPEAPAESDAPEDPEKPQDPELPEEPEDPEAPEEPAEPETPDESENDPFGAFGGGRIMSEPVGARKKIEESGVTVTAGLTVAGASGDCTLEVLADSADYLYLIAESKTVRYYLAKKSVTGGQATYSVSPVLLPEGEYSLAIAAPQADGSLKVQRAQVPLTVLPAPAVIATAADQNGDDSGVLQVTLPKDLSGISALGIEMFFDRRWQAWDDPIPVAALEGDGLKREFSGFSAGEYRVRYYGSAGSMTVSSDWALASVLEETTASGFAAFFEGKAMDDPNPTEITLYYKGATAKIGTFLFNGEADADDARATFKSDNPKIATVDAAGNVTAVGPGTTTVTVTSAAYDLPPVVLTVNVEPIAVKTLKFEKDKLSIHYADTPQPPLFFESSDLRMELTDVFPAGLDTIPVTFTGSGGGLKVLDQELVMAALDEGIIDDPFEVFEDPAYYSTSSIYPFDASLTEISVPLQATEGGHYTLTAECLGKTAVFTVDVDGWTNTNGSWNFTDATQFYYGGKPISGWMALVPDEEGHCSAVVQGASVLKGNLTDKEISYFDPGSKCVVAEGVRKIDKSLYLFHEGVIWMNWHDPEGVGETAVNGSTYYVTKNGSLKTGWVDVDNGKYSYFDPAAGKMAKNAWVPARSGKGTTWVNGDGLNMDQDGNSMELDGFHRIAGSWYVFSKGVRQTGWQYFAEDDGMLVLSTAKAGLYKAYCDPARDGKVAEGRFWADGKEYWGITGWVDADALVIIPGPIMKTYSGGKIKDAKYLFIDTTSLPPEAGAPLVCYIAGPDGSIVKNMFVSAYPMTGSSPDVAQYMYAKADGSIAKNEWITVGGKSYYFDANGVLDTGEIATEYFVINGNAPVRVTAQIEKKPTDGYSYFAEGVNGGKKLTNVALLKDYDDENVIPVLVLDKKGKPVSNTVCSARVDISQKDTLLFAVGADGKVIIQGDLLDIGSIYKKYTVVSVAGKFYAVTPHGEVCTQPGLVEARPPENANSGHNWTYIYHVGKGGALTRNALATVKGTDGKTTYSAWFGDDCRNSANAGISGFSGHLLYDGIYAKGKLYAAKKVDAPVGDGTELGRILVINKPQKAGFYEGKPVYLNKDGSVKAGWQTMPDGSRYYAVTMTGPEGGSMYTESFLLTYGEGTLFKIGGKLYLFDEAGVMKTGWVRLDRSVMVVSFAKSSYEIEDDIPSGTLLCFDPKGGAALAGGWKKAPVPVVIGGQFSVGAEEWNFDANSVSPVNASAKAAKLYFDADGSLVCSTTMQVGKKLYLFAADGTSTLTEGWLDADRTMYVLKSGQLAVGRQKVGTQFYFFDSDGVRQTNVLRKTGGKWYFYGGTGAQVTRPMGMNIGSCYVGGLSNRNLTAVWDKDGALAKVVYTGSGKPAAGETVSFGWWDTANDAASLRTYDNGYLLDSKGLPVTGLVSGFRLAGGSTVYSMLLNDDGSRIFGEDSGSLVPYGKKIYVLCGGLICTNSNGFGRDSVAAVTDWSRLSAADRKTMDSFSVFASLVGESFSVVHREDGSVYSDEVLFDVFYINRLGIIMNQYCPIFKFGSKWYTSYPENTVFTLENYLPSGEDEEVSAVIKVKSTVTLGEITVSELSGFYDAETGKALTGTYAIDDGPAYMLLLKNGLPLSGKQTVYGVPFYSDPQIGVFMNIFD